MKREGNQEPLKPSFALYATGVSQRFSDEFSFRYIGFLAVSVGISVSQMGFLNAAQSLSLDFLQLIWGRMGDRYGKRIFVAVGRLFSGILLAAVIFAETPMWFIPLVIGMSISWSIAIPSWSGLLGEYSSFAGRGEFLGRINAVSQTGGLSAMLIAFALSLYNPAQTNRESYIPLIAISSVFSILSGFLIIFVEERQPEPIRGYPSMLKFLKDTRLRRYLSLNFLYFISMSFAWPLLPFIVIDKLGMKIWQIAAYSVCASILSIMSQRYLGLLMDKVGRRPVIFFTRISSCLIPLVYAFATSWIHIFIVEAVAGITMGAWMVSTTTYILDLAPSELRATYLATNSATFGLASFMGAITGGYVTDNILSAGGYLNGISSGLIISAILRIPIALLYLKIFETYSIPPP